MKQIKRVTSLVLALLMVVGALVVLPTEAKAATIYTFVPGAEANKPDGAFEIDPAAYCSNYVEGGDYTVTVKLTSDAFFNGIIGGDSNGTWTTTGQQDCNGGTTTWTLDLTPMTGKPQVQVWWMNGATVTIDEITVTPKNAGEPGGNEPGGNEPGGNEPGDASIHTFRHGTQANKSDGDFAINPATYCSNYEEGKDYTITVKLSSDGYCNGIIGASSTSSYTWTPSAQQECNGGTATWTLEVTEMYGNPQVQIWWMNDDCTYVKIDEITVTAKTAGEPVIDHKGDASMTFVALLAGAALVTVGVASRKRFA